MSVDSFRAAMIGGGARANQFVVTLSFPTFVTGGAIASQYGQFMCKAASLPASKVNQTPVYYRGRQVKLAGEREFDDWQVTIFNDNNMMIRNALEKWSHAINNNIGNTGIINPAAYMVDMSVTQLDRNGVALKSYKFVGSWPANVGEIALDFDQNNQVETFPVTFAVQRWESEGVTSASEFGVSVGVNTPLGTFGTTL